MHATSKWLLHPRQQWHQRRRRASYLKEIDEYGRKRDPLENAESTPPEDEEIHLHPVWVAESYPLSFVDSLLDAVRRLTKDDPHVLGEPPAERLEEGLRLGGSGSIPLGTVVSPGSHRYTRSPRIEIALPSGVSHGRASIHYLVPSHAVLVVCFVLDDAGSRRGEHALRATYRSKTTERGRTTVTHGPANQMRDAIRATRGQQLSALATIFAREAPEIRGERPDAISRERRLLEHQALRPEPGVGPHSPAEEVDEVMKAPPATFSLVLVKRFTQCRRPEFDGGHGPLLAHE